MNARSFLDTNILLYADDRASPKKQRRAIDLVGAALMDQRGVVSTQVVQEYFWVATRKLRLEVEMARRKVELICRLQRVVLDHDDVLAAIDLHRLHRLAFWDALIVRAALVARCEILYSEDFQDGARIQGLQIVNPFVA